MADTKVTALSELSVPELEDLLYAVEDPAGTPTSRKLTFKRGLGQLLRGLWGFRLSTETGVAVSLTDQTAKGTIYAVPYGPFAGLSTIYDGTRWGMYADTEKSLALTVTSGSNYDVFWYDNSGTRTLELSGAWTNATTRADALTVQDSIAVKSGATTRLHVGTIRASGTNTTEVSMGGATSQVGGKLFVWNRYNQVPMYLTVHDTDDAWNYTTDTWRQKNGAAGNKVEYVTGDAASLLTAESQEVMYLIQEAGNQPGRVGIGVDSTSASSGLRQGGILIQVGGGTANYSAASGVYSGRPGLGYHYLAELERGGTTTSYFLGDNGGDGQQTGMYAWLLG